MEKNRKNSGMLSDQDNEESEIMMTQMFIEDELNDPTSKL